MPIDDQQLKWYPPLGWVTRQVRREHKQKLNEEKRVLTLTLKQTQRNKRQKIYALKTEYAIKISQLKLELAQKLQELKS